MSTDTITARQETIDSLIQYGYPPTPSAPEQDAQKYPQTKGGKIVLDKDGNPKPKYCGKNPSYLDKKGSPHILEHKPFHEDRFPTEAELSEWFANPETRVGTFGGWNNTIWLDFDLKLFSNQDEIDKAIEAILEAHPELKKSWIERTHSGGWRIAVKVKQWPDFTLFAMEPGGKHRGEALGKGKFTVLAPSIGPSGNPYVCINRAIPVEVESLESIGIYPHKAKKKTGDRPKPVTPKPSVAVAGSILLEELGTEDSRKVLNGEDIKGDRSESLTLAINEWYGWENWAVSYNIPINGRAEDLAHYAGDRMGIDSDRVDRILKTVDPLGCLPAALSKGGEVSCWLKVRKLSSAIYEELCPEFIKQSMDSKPKGNGAKIAIDGDRITPESSDEVFTVWEGKALKACHQVKTTSDDNLFTHFFECGKGEWSVIDETYYRYSGKGYHEPVPDPVVNRMIGMELRELYAPKFDKDGQLSNISFNYATDRNLKSAFNFCRKTLNVGAPPNNQALRAFRNCTLNFNTGETTPHSKEDYLTSCIDADYIPGMECPSVFRDELIGRSYGDDESTLELIQAVIYFYLDPTAPSGKFVHLMGPSGSGKGTFIRFMLSLIGEKSTRSMSSFAELSTPEGRHQNLSGVALCVFPDVGGYQQGLRAFYELVDNGPMSGRALFSPQGYQKKWNVDFMVGSVDHLQIENSNDGWDRRVIRIVTKGSVSNPDSTLEARLSTPEVKAGVISWALSMDKAKRDEILRNADKINARTIEARHEALLAGDPIRAFVDHCLRPNSNTTKVKSADLHTYFCAYADAFGYQRIGEKKFAHHLRTIIPKHYRERTKATKSNGLIPDCQNEMVSAGWINIRLLPNIFPDSQRNGSIGLTCNKSAVQEGGLYEFEEFPPNLDRIDRILATKLGEVCDPTQNPMNSTSQEFRSDRSDRSDTFSLYAGNESTQPNVVNGDESAGKEDFLYRPLPPSDLYDLSDPKLQNGHEKGVLNGSHTEPKYPIQTQSMRSKSDPPSVVKVGDRVQYIGQNPGLKRVCGSKPLTVLSVDGDVATVQGDEWASKITREAPIKDLRSIES